MPPESSCLHLPYLCQQEWEFTRKWFTINTENTPKKPCTTLIAYLWQAFFFFIKVKSKSRTLLKFSIITLHKTKILINYYLYIFRYLQSYAHCAELWCHSTASVSYATNSKTVIISYWQHTNSVHLYFGSFYPHNRMC